MIVGIILLGILSFNVSNRHEVLPGAILLVNMLGRLLLVASFVAVIKSIYHKVEVIITGRTLGVDKFRKGDT